MSGGFSPLRLAQMRHYGGFVLAGTLAYLTDATVYMLLMQLTPVPALLARLASISVAMIVSWLVNRSLTFAVEKAPSLKELLQFAGMAWISAAVNYGVFAALLLTVPDLWPPLAIALSSLVAMVVAYVGMRFAVFRRR